MNRFQLNQTLAVVRALDIAHNGAPEAIFDPLLQGFNVWKDLLKKWIEDLYKYMGWVDIDPDGNILHGLIEQARKDPDFVELANLYSTYTALGHKLRFF